ncbi:hypothetical protein ABE10_03080, partial [Bacillus toyonensis]|nr:hypothetical protein [Bacillus toyonensis]
APSLRSPPASPIDRTGDGMSRSGPLRCGVPIADALSHDGGDPVLTHRDPVERVGDLHRPLLVGDDQQLRALPELFEHGEKTPEVRVVQGCLDLVQDVERAGTCFEDRHEERDGRQRALPAGEEGEAFDLLPDGTDGDLDPGVQQVIGRGERDAARTTGEEQREDLTEGLSGVLERVGEDRLHPLVQVRDDREQVLPRLGEVGELFGEEGMPLFQRGELLERQRVDAAEL